MARQTKFLFAFSILVVLAWGYFYFNHNAELAGYRQIKIGEKSLLVRIADTPVLREKGLQGVSEMGNDEGMLFVFPEKSFATFWNKNTLLDLDLIWVLNSKVVGIDFLPHESAGGIVRLRSPGEIDMVIETNANWALQNGISEGMRVLVP